MKKILVCAGHTLEGGGSGAVGYINESAENRHLSKAVVSYLKRAGFEVDYYEVNSSKTYLQDQVNYANRKKYDLVVQIHFNAFKTTSNAMGSEVLYCSERGRKVAVRVADKLGRVFKNRGVKLRNDLYWLNRTKACSILIETCFVDSSTDVEIYRKNFDNIARLIAEGVSDTLIPSLSLK